MPALVRSPFDLISILHDRMTGEQELDALLTVYGEKGSGKSEGCMYIGERLSIRLGNTFNKPPEEFFTIDNVRSVDQEGTLKMFTAEQFKKKKHQVFVIDDASISANARKFMTDNNNRLNAIMTIARIYRHCIILNTVSPDLIDTVLRGFANISSVVMGPEMSPLNPLYRVNKMKIYAMYRGGSPTDKTKHFYNKYFQFKGKDGRMNRIVVMRTRQPSPELLAQYKALRKEKTDAYIDNVFTQPNNGQSIKRANAWQEKVTKHMEKVVSMNSEGRKISDIMRATGLSSYAIYKMIGMGGSNDRSE